MSTVRAFLLLAAFGGCVAARAPAPAPAPAPAEPALQTFSGTYFTAFEISMFGGCWLEWSAEGGAAFERRQPEIMQALNVGGHEYEIAFEGRMEEYRGPLGGGFGHMSIYPCRIEVIRLLDSRLVNPTPDRLPPPQ